MFRLLNRSKDPPPSLGEQLRILANCGIRLRPDRTIEDVRKVREVGWSDPDVSGEDAWALLLTDLAMELDTDPPGQYLSDDIAWFDAECIYDHGDYACIVQRLATIAGGDLPVENVRDHVDTGKGEIWVEFELDGKPRRFEPTFEDDWLDPRFMTWMASILERRNTGRRFTRIDLGGQDALIGCATPAQRRRLRKATGLNVVWLR